VRIKKQVSGNRQGPARGGDMSPGLVLFSKPAVLSAYADIIRANDESGKRLEKRRLGLLGRPFQKLLGCGSARFVSCDKGAYREMRRTKPYKTRVPFGDSAVF